MGGTIFNSDIRRLRDAVGSVVAFQTCKAVQSEKQQRNKSEQNQMPFPAALFHQGK